MIVYYDGSVAAQRALLAAIELARRGRDAITVIVTSENHLDSVLEKGRFAGMDLRIRRVSGEAAASAENLLAALKSEQGSVLVLGSRKFLEKLPPLDVVLRETGMGVLLLQGD